MTRLVCANRRFSGWVNCHLVQNSVLSTCTWLSEYFQSWSDLLKKICRSCKNYAPFLFCCAWLGGLDASVAEILVVWPVTYRLAFWKFDNCVSSFTNQMLLRWLSKFNLMLRSPSVALMLHY